MVACGEAGDDGDEVFRKLLVTRRGDGVSFFDNVTCCSTVPRCICLTENHGFALMLPTDVVDEVDGEAGDAVSVTGHNFADLIAHDGVQKGKELGPLPVDPTPNLFDELILGPRFLESFCLACEVLCLLGA